MNRFVWAHRGASSVAPENTMAAFAVAEASGADGIELDVHLTSDGVPVVIHDDTLDRTTDGAGLVGSACLGGIRELDAGGWFSAAFAGEPVPTLEEVLETFSGQLHLNLELKDFDAGFEVLELLSQYEDAEVVISSFNYPLLLWLRSQDARLPLAVLYDEGNWYRSVALAVQLSAVSFHPRADLFSRPMASRCHDVGLQVFPWTVDDPRDIRKLMRAGADGFFTNDPLKARSACSDRL